MWTQSSSWKDNKEPDQNQKVWRRGIWKKVTDIKTEAWIALLAFLLSIYSVASSEQQSKTDSERNRKQLQLTEKSVELSEKQFKEAIINNKEQLNVVKKSYELSEKNFMETSKNNKEQIKLSQEHAKLSVRPKVEFQTFRSSNADPVGIAIFNKGLGPAIFIEQEIFFDGERILDFDDLSRKIRSRNLAFWLGYISPYWFNVHTTSLLPGETKFVYFVPKDELDLTYFKNIVECFSLISIRYKYTDMYSDTFSIAFHPTLIQSPR